MYMSRVRPMLQKK